MPDPAEVFENALSLDVQGCSLSGIRMSGVPRHTARIDGFFSSLYSDLRRLAHQRLLRNETITLLNTTALVHESYLKQHSYCLRHSVMAGGGLALAPRGPQNLQEQGHEHRDHFGGRVAALITRLVGDGISPAVAPPVSFRPQ